MYHTTIYTPFGYMIIPVDTSEDPLRSFLISNSSNPQIITIPISNRTLFFDNISETERAAEQLELSERFRSSRIFKWKGITCKKLYSDNDLTIFQAAGISKEMYLRYQSCNQYIIDHELYIYAYIHNNMAPSDIAQNWFDPDFDSDEKIFTHKNMAFELNLSYNDDVLIPIRGRLGDCLSALSLNRLVTMGLGNSDVFKICTSLENPGLIPMKYITISENMAIDMKKIWHVGRAMVMYGHSLCKIKDCKDIELTQSQLLLWLITYESNKED